MKIVVAFVVISAWPLFAVPVLLAIGGCVFFASFVEALINSERCQ